MAMLTLAMLGGTNGASVAQEDGDTFVTGSTSCRGTDTFVRRASAGVDLFQIDGRCTMEMSDPRVSGFMLTSAQTACFEEAGGACLSGGTIEVVPGPEGRWIGTWGSIARLLDTDQPTWATMEGTGAYEGWTFWFHTQDRQDESSDLIGIIVEGPPPPWKTSLPLEPAE